MLKKIYRLPSFCFKRAYQKGKTKRGRFINLRVAENNKALSRFGFVVSTKVIKEATQRNLIKRRLSSIINSNLRRIKPGLDFIITIQEEAGFKDLEGELEELFNV